ncbi:MAG: PD-(D/E)XK nuclease family transposase, partial [Peptostreptococcaceae bacterium]
MPRYINPFTDFGFKKLFGEEESKEILIAFLNDLLPIKDKIVNIEFKKNEQLGINSIARKAIYDVYCEDEKGSKFIVEMQ